MREQASLGTPGAMPPDAACETSTRFLDGGGAVGALVRAYPWATTPLGSIEGWPQSLRTALSIVLASRFPMALWWGTEHTQFYNDAYIPVLGSKHPRALAARAWDCWAEIWDVIGPMARQVVQTGEATWSADLLLLMERAGFLEETYFTFSYSPIRDESASVGGVLVTCTETTERLLSERRLSVLRELAESSLHAATVEQAIASSMAVLAEAKKDIACAAMYVREKGALRRVAEAGLPEAGLPDIPAEITLAEAGREASPFEHVLASGEVLVVRDVASRFGRLPGGEWEACCETAVVLPVAKPGHEPLGALLVGLSPRRGVDEQYLSFVQLVAGQVATAVAAAEAHEEERRRAEELAELDRAKTAFFSNVSHEFRTPLTLLLGPLEDILADRSAVSPRAREHLEVVQRNGQRLLKLVNTLLDFARIEAGRAQATYEPTDVSALTAELASTFRSAVERAALRLRIDCPPLPEPAYVDRDMWEKIILNLLSNALKFTFEGEISVSVSLEPSSVLVVVRDTGTGIPAGELEHLFERFHRVRGARARTHEGTGIGLALVHELVRLHQGTIDVESTEGVGTAFHVRIPRGYAHLPQDRIGVARTTSSTSTGAAAYVNEALRWLPEGEPGTAPMLEAGASELVADPTAASAPRARATGPRARILLADDNADMREYLARLLLERWDVDAVGDGAKALAAARAAPPDLVLADVMMPGLDGFQLLKALREDPRTRTKPVILLSARAGEEATVEGLAAGANDYLVKPFSSRELVARVAAQLEIARVRAEAEAARREHDERLRMALEAARMIAWEWQPEIDEVTATDLLPEIYGVTGLASTAEGLPLLLPEDRERHAATLRRVAAEGGVYRSEFRLRRPDNGQVIWLEERGTSVVDERGRVVAVRGLTQDITDRKRSEDEREQLLAREQEARRMAEEASRLKDEFLATVSHELRTPLNAIVGWASLLRRETALDTPIARRAIEVIDRSAKSQSQIIEDILDVSRIITGKMTVEPQGTDLAAIVREAADSVRHAAAAKDVTLTFDMPDPFYPLVGDPGRLRQVVWNLLSNAIRYTDRGGRVSVSITRQGNRLELAVSDTGRGIDASFLPYVWDRFRQADGSTTRTQGGLGLGLAIVRHLVEMHGGTVRAESEGLGKGATFRIRLPLRPDTPVVTVAAKRRDVGGAPLPSDRPLEGCRVLVVEDEDDARHLLDLVLTRAGAEVRTARAASEAVAAVRERQPDVLVCDIGLPECDGYAVLTQIRALGLNPPVLPALALTAYARTEDASRALRAGFAMHMAKPVEPDRVLSAVATLARRSERL